jgi:hypothetical protein
LPATAPVHQVIPSLRPPALALMFRPNSRSRLSALKWDIRSSHIGKAYEGDEEMIRSEKAGNSMHGQEEEEETGRQSLQRPFGPYFLDSV